MYSGIDAVSLLSGNAKITPCPIEIASPKEYGQSIHDNRIHKLFRFSVASKDRTHQMQGMIEVVYLTFAKPQKLRMETDSLKRRGSLAIKIVSFLIIRPFIH